MEEVFKAITFLKKIYQNFKHILQNYLVTFQKILLCLLLVICCLVQNELGTMSALILKCSNLYFHSYELCYRIVSNQHFIQQVIKLQGHFDSDASHSFNKCHDVLSF